MQRSLYNQIEKDIISSLLGTSASSIVLATTYITRFFSTSPLRCPSGPLLRTRRNISEQQHYRRTFLRQFNRKKNHVFVGSTYIHWPRRRRWVYMLSYIYIGCLYFRPVPHIAKQDRATLHRGFQSTSVLPNELLLLWQSALNIYYQTGQLMSNNHEEMMTSSHQPLTDWNKSVVAARLVC